MAEDQYTVVIQAEFDKSPAGEARLQQSANELAKRCHGEVQLVASQESIEGINEQLNKGIQTIVLKTSLDMGDVQKQLQRQHLKTGIVFDVDSAYQEAKASIEAKIAELSKNSVSVPFHMQGATNGVSATGPVPFDLASGSQYEAYLTTVDRAQRQAAQSADELAAARDRATGNSARRTAATHEETKAIQDGTGALKDHAGAEEKDANALRKNTDAENDNTGAKSSNDKITGGLIGRLAAYAFSLANVIRYLREMINITIELNDAMTQLKIVTQSTDEEYARYASNISKTATEIGIATKDLIDASTVYARLGYNLDESSALAKYTGMLQNVGDIEAGTAQSAITSIVKAFDIDISGIESVMDKLIVVGNSFPISVSQIAEGMMNASSSLHAAGNSLDQSIALLTAANTTTQDISKASTAVRTISARLRNTKAELDELGEVVTEAKYQELVDMITGQGVSLIDEQTGDLRSTYDVLKDLAEIWETIGVNERAALATQIAGVRQQNVFYSILEQFKEAEQAMDAMEGSAGALDTAYDIYMDSITAHINQFKAAWQSLSQTVMDSGLITSIVDAGTALIGFLDRLIQALNILNPLISIFNGIKTVFLPTGFTDLEIAQGAQVEIEDLNNKLAKIQERIGEIQKSGQLSLTDAKELGRLQAEQDTLVAQLRVQERLLEVRKESARLQALSEVHRGDTGTQSAIDTYNQAKKQQQEAEKQTTELTALYSQLDSVRAQMGDVDLGTVAGVEGYERLQNQAANIEREIQNIIDELENAGSVFSTDVPEAIGGVESQIAHLQEQISALDPEKDAEAIKQYTAEILQLYNAIGAQEEISLSLGGLLDQDATTQINNIISGIKEGYDVGWEVTKLWNSLNKEGGLVEYLEGLGVHIDSSDLIHYILSLVRLEKEAPAAANANDKVADSLNDAIGKAKKISPAMKQLNEIYADISNGKKFDFNRLLNNDDFVEAFGGLGEAYTEFLQTVASSPDDIEKVQEAFNKLTEAYVDQEGVLDNLTMENRDMAAAMLEMMGVTNANEIVNTALAQQELANITNDVTNALLPEITALYDEAQASAVAGGMVANLVTNKDAVNSATINTAADIQNIIDLANASYAGADALYALEEAKRRLALAADFQAQGNFAMAKVAADTSAAWLEKAKREWNTGTTVNPFRFDGGNASTSSGSGGGGGSSSKEVEEYIADIDKYYAALKRLESAKLSMADANRRLEATEDLNEKIRITKEIIDLYQTQADAEAELIELRRQTIETESEGLRALGFEIEYNNKTNEFYVANLEHINELTADAVGEYDSLEEATNALRKETEDLINSLDDLNQENQEGVESLHDLSQSAKEARQSIVDLYDSIVEEANDVVDGFQNVYKVLTDAAKEYAQTGYLSVDSLQAILDLGPKYLAMLVDENGQLVINEQNLQAVIAAKTQDMAAETALSYAKQVLLATERGEEDVLRNLTDATAASSAATWDLAFATVGLAKAIGTANGMSEEYYDNAVSYLTSMQSLTETAVNSIPQYYETLKSSYISQADALDQILKLTEDMLKWEQQQQIDALNKQKDAYADIINQKKELLELTKEEQDHEKDLAEKIAEIAKLQSRIDQLSLDDSREAQAQKRKLEEELAKLQKGLTDDQAGYALDVQNDALDKQLEMYENEKDDEIAALEDSLNSAEKLYQAALHELESDYNGTIERLKTWNYEVGNTLQQSLLDAIDAATAALDRFGGSFTAALEGVEGYTNLGTNNTSGAATSASANNIISAMRKNSIDWWTSPSSGQAALSSQQASLAQQYRDLSGDNIYSQNGKWYHANGEQLYSLSNNDIAKAIVNKMKENSAAWFNTNDTGKQSLNADNVELAKRLSLLLGTDVTRDANGTWWINGKKLYDVYHSGGIVGRGSFKQNEVMALLEKGEAVLDEQKQKAMYKAVDFVSTLAEKIGNAVDVSRLFGGISPAAAGAGYASLMGGGLSGAGGLFGNCTIERIDVVAPIQVVQKLDRAELEAHADMIGALSAQYIKDGFTKRGIRANVSAL